MQVVIRAFLRVGALLVHWVVLDLNFFIFLNLMLLDLKIAAQFCEEAETPRTQHVDTIGHIIEPKTHLRQ